MDKHGKAARRAPRALLAAAAFAFLSLGEPARAQEAAFYPLGLPSSRSLSPVFNRYASLPPFTARQPARGELFLVPTLELSQVMLASWKVQPDGSEILESDLDFEALSLELPVSWGLTDGISLELDLQVQYIWGGFLDGIIEGFHGLFGFPNGGREEVPAGQVVVDVDTRNGYSLKLEGPALLVSDPVLGAAFRLVRTPFLGLTGRAMAAVPLGLGKGLAGNGLPQLGAGVYADLRPAGGLSIHAMAGGVLPLESFGWTGPRPYPLFQARASVLARLGRVALLFVDLNFRTSPTRGYILDGGKDLFGQPNADLLVGLVFSGPAARREGRFGSFSVQEDPITHNASDIRFLASGAFRWGKTGPGTINPIGSIR